MKKFLVCFFCLTLLTSGWATDKISINEHLELNSNPGYWQQHVDYTMEIDIDVDSYQYVGKQKLVYTNNSPDILRRGYNNRYFRIASNSRIVG